MEGKRSGIISLLLYRQWKKETINTIGIWALRMGLLSGILAGGLTVNEKLSFGCGFLLLTL